MAVPILTVLLWQPPVHGDTDGLQRADLGRCALDGGGVIEECVVRFRTFGRLAADRGNVLVFPTWYGGTSADLVANGLIGPGAVADTDRFFVVAVDAFGNGLSSSPSSSRQQAGEHFPEFSIGDMVTAHHRLLREVLGFGQVYAVVGVSMGGMQALEWAVRFPDAMQRVVAIEGTPWPTAIDFFIWFLIIDLSWSIVYAVSPWQSSRHLMARDEHVVLRASIYACFAVIFMQYLIYGAGGLINLANPAIEPAETVMIWAAQHLVPEFLGALLLAGIVAAALSSASTFLSLVGFSVSNDLGARDQIAGLGTTRLVMCAVALVVLGLSLFVPANIFWIMIFIGTVFASSWGPVAFMSVWSKRITARAATWGLVVGLFANVVPAAFDYAGVIALPSYADPALLGVAASFLAIVVVSRRGTPGAKEVAYRERLHETPEVDRDRRKTRVTLLAPALLVVYGACMPVLLLRFYVLPYQRGSGSLGAGGGINWSEAEPWFAFGPALLFIPLGTLAAVVIWRRYAPSLPI